MNLLRTILSKWNRLWFSPVPVCRVAVFRIVIAAYCLVDIGADFGGVAGFPRADATFYKPILLLRVLHVPRATPDAWLAVRVVLLVALALATIGLFTRVALWVAGPLYLWWWSTYNSYGPIGHSRMTIVIALLVLAVAPAGRAYSLDAVIRRSRSLARPAASIQVTDPFAGWALRTVTFAVVIGYSSAAYTKYRTAGIGWPFGGAFDAALIEKSTWGGNLLSQHIWIVHALAVAALILESTAWVVFFRGRVRDVWCLTGAGFHVGTLVVLNIDFIPWILTYAAFYDLEFAAARVSGWAARAGRRRGTPVKVLYDGDCGLCLRTVSVLQSLDWFKRLEFHDASVVDSRPDAMYAITNRGTYRGFFAFRSLARSVPALWPALSVAYLPGVPRIGERIYAHVAANRGTAGSCVIDSATVSSAEKS